ncbi:hypothetical protein AQ611_18305 [Burkholderia singularis]|nr:hypothetical protein AQ611_18305 [Burkholderia sp. Bp7605]
MDKPCCEPQWQDSEGGAQRRQYGQPLAGCLYHAGMRRNQRVAHAETVADGTVIADRPASSRSFSTEC